MIVCHCHGISDRAIRQAVRGGAGCAAEVSVRCGAGSTCGGCSPLIEAIVEGERRSGAAAVALAAPALPRAG